MSSVNYNLNNKGVRLIDSENAWVRGKNGKYKLNKKYKFYGKIDKTMPGMIVSAGDKTKPKYCGDVCELNKTAKSEIINHFYNDDGKRNRKKSCIFWYREKRKSIN